MKNKNGIQVDLPSRKRFLVTAVVALEVGIELKPKTVYFNFGTKETVFKNLKILKGKAVKVRLNLVPDILVLKVEVGKGTVVKGNLFIVEVLDFGNLKKVNRDFHKKVEDVNFQRIMEGKILINIVFLYFKYNSK